MNQSLNQTDIRQILTECIRGTQHDMRNPSQPTGLIDRVSQTPKPEFFPNTEVHCSVALIFRTKTKLNSKIKNLSNPKNNKNNKVKSLFNQKFKKFDPPFLHLSDIEPIEFETELLFLKRTPNPKDKFSGNVCFPGGHRDDGESLFTNVKREVREETGLDISSKNGFHFLGYLSELKCFTKKNGKIVKVLPFIFLCDDFDYCGNLTLQTREVCDHIWTPFHTLLNSVRTNSQFKQKLNPFLTLLHSTIDLKPDWMLLKGLSMGFFSKFIYKAVKYDPVPEFTKFTNEQSKSVKSLLQKICDNGIQILGILTVPNVGYSYKNELELDLFYFRKNRNQHIFKYALRAILVLWVLYNIFLKK